MNINDLKEYRKLKLEREDIRRRINNMKEELAAYEEVSETVQGGEGGKRRFKVNGNNNAYYSQRKTTLLSSRLRMEQIDNELNVKLDEIEEYIKNIPDSTQRTILRLHYQDGLSWTMTAKKLGDGYTGDAIRISTARYMRKK